MIFDTPPCSSASRGRHWKIALCSLSTAALIMARLFGMERSDALRFVLLSSLVILLVDGVSGLFNATHGVTSADGLAFGLSFVAAMIALPIGFALIRRAGLLPFALYRLLFGAALVALGLL